MKPVSSKAKWKKLFLVTSIVTFGFMGYTPQAHAEFSAQNVEPLTFVSYIQLDQQAKTFLRNEQVGMAQAIKEQQVEAEKKRQEEIKRQQEELRRQEELRKQEELRRQQERQFYSESLPLPKAQQEYLHKLTQERGLDYKETLAVMMVESSFNPNCYYGGSYGYFQIHRVNHARLARELGTANNPYDPYVNMNWGTHMLQELYQKYEARGLRGESLKNAVLSAYNKGEGGYARTGLANNYIHKNEQRLQEIQQMFS